MGRIKMGTVTQLALRQNLHCTAIFLFAAQGTEEYRRYYIFKNIELEGKFKFVSIKTIL